MSERRRPVPRPAQRDAGAQRLRLAAARPRLRLVSVGLTLVMLVFTVRLLQVQAVDASEFSDKAKLNRYVPIELAAERGRITDRDGTLLATNVDAYDITADPLLFTPEQSGTKDAPKRAAEKLAPVLGKDAAELEKKLAAPKSRYVRLARQQTPQTWKHIKKMKEKTTYLAGVFAEEQAKRVYPNGDLAAGMLGWVNAEGKGGGGVEGTLNKTLSGKDGKLVYAQSAGRRIPTAGSREVPPEPGDDVELTIDRDIQWAAQDALSQQVKKSNAERGYVVVQDTRTGQILALANAPGFDPNDISGSRSDALGNAALTDVYEPGSVNKVISMSAVLEEGAAVPSTHVTVPNTLQRADRVFHDDVDHPTWYLTLNGVLAKSSNIGTILATEQLGDSQPEANQVLHSYLRKFGLGAETGLGLPESPGLLAKPKDWNASQQYTIPFGQGLSLNAVQAASVYSTIANGGIRVQPSLIRGSKGPDGHFTESGEPKQRRVVSEKTAKTVSKMLESVVDDEEGTGVLARMPGYRAAGKTGTSNRVDPDTGRYNGYTASFAGFAPADKPRVTVYCAVQDPKKGSYFGGQVCGPVYKKVMEFALKTLQVPPTGAKPPRLPVTFEPGEKSEKSGKKR
ncbi:penicillin-binding protein 2 [Streptomyces sp. A7024]|uniref:Penicillin-binding protein 2 n=1 Tax=Streptomyces coryli TaxID=1128680 RepID=A0A6G4U2R7_9ACTN|nr:penicillin-binding protein 2 [Streptomyces coryli]NGN66454.1 penicillin-binding protein 2 [Streptomyces coryli]